MQSKTILGVILKQKDGSNKKMVEFGALSIPPIGLAAGASQNSHKEIMLKLLNNVALFLTFLMFLWLVFLITSAIVGN